MSLSDPAPARKTGKVSRLGLYAPYIVAVVVIAVWSGAWIWIRSEVLRRLDAARADLNAAGYHVAWKSVRAYGYPFRLDVDFERLVLADPSGWAVSLPALKTEAWAYAPDHWMLVAPDGVTVTRPADGALRVEARALRASLAGLDRTPPRLSVEGLDLRFIPAPGAKPFFITAAKGLQLHLRPGPDDQGAVFLGLDQANAHLTGLVGRIAEGRPVSLTAEAILSHMSAFSGPDWATAVRAWAAGDGTAHLRQLRIAAGEALLDAHTGELTVAGDGSLQGSLTASLREAAAKDSPPAATVTVDFRHGLTTLGRFGVGPAPRVY